jgi:hypothetical protein
MISSIKRFLSKYSSILFQAICALAIAFIITQEQLQHAGLRYLLLYFVIVPIVTYTLILIVQGFSRATQERKNFLKKTLIQDMYLIEIVIAIIGAFLYLHGTRW